jgi:hypothetical protein
VGLVPVHVPCCVTTQGPYQPCTPCRATTTTRALEPMRVGSNTFCNDSPPRCWARLRLAAL